ncbi:hypothetical protein [uncultured Parasphingorhabdus sp.]|uniref:beta family protein n=1 Tax=uncultured Parasphingorhabdus sp. TaxID=2709694 RepID=UPI002AA77D11|nr:hypothetical protein [uncultured Parasphingorhabdus sp.]
MNRFSFKYAPQLKWKLAEYSALGALSDRDGPEVLPIFKLPPSGSYDFEAKKPLAATEHIKTFGDRLFKHWGNRIAVVDAGLLEPKTEIVGLENHPLWQVYQRTKVSGSKVAPCCQLTSTQGYLDATKAIIREDQNMPLVVRILLSDIENGLTLEALSNFVGQLECSPERTVLLFDAGPINSRMNVEFAELVASAIVRLCPPQFWHGIIWSATGFPSDFGLKPGQTGEYPRVEKDVYELIYDQLRGSKTEVCYSDYSVEYPGNYEPAKGPIPASAHLRYTTPTSYIVVKGVQCKNPVGYEAIKPVAKTLIEHPSFKGGPFSDGDRLFEFLGTSETYSGGPTTWRKAANQHHLALLLSETKTRLGDKYKPSRASSKIGQLALDTV